MNNLIVLGSLGHFFKLPISMWQMAKYISTCYRIRETKTTNPKSATIYDMTYFGGAGNGKIIFHTRANLIVK